MTFHELLIFLSLGSYTCKVEGFIYLYSPLTSLEESGCTCRAFCPSGVSLPPNSVGRAGKGAQKEVVIGSGHQQRLETMLRVRWGPGSGGVPCTLLVWLSLLLPFACEVPSSSWALPLIFVCPPPPQRLTHPYRHLFCGLFFSFFFFFKSQLGFFKL